MGCQDYSVICMCRCITLTWSIPALISNKLIRTSCPSKILVLENNIPEKIGLSCIIVLHATFYRKLEPQAKLMARN